MKIKIGYRVDDKTYQEVKSLAKKERWSIAKLSEVALEYYLKLRGVKE